MHGFCRVLLAQTKQEAQKYGVEVPKNLTALESSGQHFIEADGTQGVWVQRGDCAYSAKAHYISNLIDKRLEEINAWLDSLQKTEAAIGSLSANGTYIDRLALQFKLKHEVAEELYDNHMRAE